MRKINKASLAILTIAILFQMTSCQYKALETTLTTSEATTSEAAPSSDAELSSDTSDSSTSSSNSSVSKGANYGKNKIESASSGTSTSTDEITNTEYSFESLSLTAPEVQYPAEVEFGTYMYMEQLIQNSGQWTFCKNNADGILLHGAYWLYDSDSTDVGQTLESIVKYTNLNLTFEYGFADSSDTHDSTLGTRMGNDFVTKVEDFENRTGLSVNEFNIEIHSFDRGYFLRDNPGMTDEESYDAIVDCWQQFFNVATATFSTQKYNFIQCPVYFSFDGLQPMVFQNDGNKFLIPILESVSSNGKQLTGQTYDCPYSYMTDSHTIPILLAYQDWLHSKGLTQTLLTNTYVQVTENQSTSDYDKAYSEGTLNAISYSQSKGFRPDKFTLESWYDGPYEIVPETTEYTFTNTVMKAIKFLKGTGQKLDMSISAEGSDTVYGKDIYASTPSELETVQMNEQTSNYTVTVVNNGEYHCMPMLKAVTKEDSGIDVKYFYNGTDITSDITSAAGFSFTDLIDKDCSDQIEVQVTKTDENASGTLAICSFYNPQDETNTIKDVVSISY